MRTVQIEITLEVDADCQFVDGNWHLEDVANIRVRGIKHGNKEALETFLCTDPTVAEKIEDAFAQQEP